MNLEPLLTASAVTTTHTINKVPYNIVKRLSDNKSPVEPNSKLLRLSLNLNLSSIFLADEVLCDLSGFLEEETTVSLFSFLICKALFTNKYNTIKPANNTAIPPIPFTTPLVLAKNAEVIPLPRSAGICISATEISTFGNPPTTTEADCKESKPNNEENIPIIPSIPP